MTYIVLRDTFGEGLIDTSDLEVLGDTEQLNEAIIGVVEESLDYGLGEKLSTESVVVCEILGEINGVDIDKYVKRVYGEYEKKEKNDRYKLYQELKAEFEP